MKCSVAKIHLVTGFLFIASAANAADFYFTCDGISSKLTMAFCKAMESKLTAAPEHNIVADPRNAVELEFATEATDQGITYIVREKIGPEVAEEYTEKQAKSDKPGPAIDRLIQRLSERQAKAQSEYEDEAASRPNRQPAAADNDPRRFDEEEAGDYEQSSAVKRAKVEGPFFALGTFQTRGLGQHKRQTQYSVGLLRGSELWLFLVRLQLAHDTGSPLTNYAAIDIGGGLDYRFGKLFFCQGTLHLGYGVVQRYRNKDEVDFDPLIGYTEEIDADRGTTLAARLGAGIRLGNIDVSLVTSANTFTEKNPHGNFPIFHGYALQLMANIN